MYSKKIPVIRILAAILAFTGLSKGALAQGENFTGNTYTITYQYPYPLDTFENCDSWSQAGIISSNFAEEEAMVECRNDHNADCVSEGAVFKSILSEQFIGYKACEATVSVHGYR